MWAHSNAFRRDAGTVECRDDFCHGLLPPQHENERKDRPPFEEKNQDVRPPSFDFPQRSKEGVKKDASQAGQFPTTRKRSSKCTRSSLAESRASTWAR